MLRFSLAPSVRASTHLLIGTMLLTAVAGFATRAPAQPVNEVTPVSMSAAALHDEPSTPTLLRDLSGLGFRADVL